MKILIFNWRDIKNPTSGGAEVLTHELAKYWVKKGHSVTIFSSFYPGSAKEESVDGVKIIREGHPDIRYIFNSVHYLAFKNYKKRFKGKFDVVIDEIHGFPFFTPFYIKEKKIALICEVADDLWIKMFGFFWGNLGRLVEIICLRWIYRKINFITISESTKNELILHGLNENQITVLPLGIETPAKIPRYKKEKNPTLIYVGRLTKSKGAEDSIYAFNEVFKKNGKSRLWVVGRGDAKYIESLKKICSNLKIDDEKISFFGFVPYNKKFELMSKAWVLLHPSMKEGWGLNVIESNFVGTPAVGYNIVGLKDTIKSGKTGMLVKPNHKALANGVMKLISNKKEYNSISKNAKKWAENFSWENCGQKSLEKIEELKNN